MAAENSALHPRNNYILKCSQIGVGDIPVDILNQYKFVNQIFDYLVYRGYTLMWHC